MTSQYIVAVQLSLNDDRSGKSGTTISCYGLRDMMMNRQTSTGGIYRGTILVRGEIMSKALR